MSRQTPGPDDADYGRFFGIIRGDETPEPVSYALGKEAYHGGLKCFDKPLTLSPVESASWRCGWDDAQKDAEKAAETETLGKTRHE